MNIILCTVVAFGVGHFLGIFIAKKDWGRTILAVITFAAFIALMFLNQTSLGLD